MKLKFIDPRMFKFIDWLLFANIIVLVLFSFVAIASADSEPLTEDIGSLSAAVAQLDLTHVMQQIAWFGISLFAMFIVLLPDYHAIAEYYKWIYVIIVGLLIAVYFFGSNEGGATGWFRIGQAGFQPSEIGKVGMIIVMAQMISKKTQGRDGGIKTVKDLLPILGVFLVPVLLIVIQPDWGTAMVYIFTFISMLFLAKTSLKLIGGLFASAAVVLPLLWFFVLTEKQKGRFYTFLGIEQAGMTQEQIKALHYQSDKAKVAVGAGQVYGKGLFSLGGESKLSNIPERHTDFIFASTSEAIGFLGIMVVILLYFILIFRTLYLATKAKDDFGSHIIIGVLAMTLFHIFENIGMNIGVMPITGIPLPFISSGGSNLLTNMIAFGLVINVSMRRQRWSF